MRILPERCSDCPASGRCIVQNLSEEAFREFSTISQLCIHGPGSRIFRQGEEVDGILLIRSGIVRLVHLSPNGRALTVGLARPGALLGLTEVITGGCHRVTGEAVESCELEHVPRKRFVPFLLKTPSLGVDLLIRVSEEFEAVLGQLCEMTAGEVSSRHRLLHAFGELAELYGEPAPEGIILKFPLTVQEVASRLGFSRQWTSNLLQQVQAEGLVQRRGRSYLLTESFFSAMADAP